MTTLYENIEFPPPNADRPFIYLNAVTTLDGKTVDEGRGGTVMQIGSKLDHATMRTLESHADAVFIGAQTVRATPNLWYQSELEIFILTRSGELPWSNRVFRDQPGNVTVVGPSHLSIPLDHKRLTFDGDPGQLAIAVAQIRSTGINRLLVEGGSQVNGLFLSQDLVDEIFVTLAPKIRLGENEPNLANYKSPFTGSEMLAFELISSQAISNELFLRYKRTR